MFGVDSSELAVVAVLALIFIGPKDLPRVMRTLGHWIAQARATSRHFTSGLRSMVRAAELEEMERKWREENDRIMRLQPGNPPLADSPADGTVRPPHQSEVDKDVPPDTCPLP